MHSFFVCLVLLLHILINNPSAAGDTDNIRSPVRAIRRLRSSQLQKPTIPSRISSHLSRWQPSTNCSLFPHLPVTLTLVLHFRDAKQIDTLHAQVFDPTHPSYLRYPSFESLSALVSPPSDVVADLHDWILQAAATSRPSGSEPKNFDVEWVQPFNTSCRIHTRVAEMERLMGGVQIREYVHSIYPTARVLHAVDGETALLARVPKHLRKHISHTLGITHLPLEEDVQRRSHRKRKQKHREAVTRLKEGRKLLPVPRFQRSAHSSAELKTPQKTTINRIATASGPSSPPIPLTLMYVSTFDQAIWVYFQLFCSWGDSDSTTYPTRVNNTAMCNSQPFTSYSMELKDSFSGIVTYSSVMNNYFFLSDTSTIAWSAFLEVNKLRNFVPYIITLRLTYGTGSTAIALVGQYMFPVSTTPSMTPSTLQRMYRSPRQPSTSSADHPVRIAIGTLAWDRETGFYSPADVAHFYSWQGLGSGPTASQILWNATANSSVVNIPSNPDNELALDLDTTMGQCPQICQIQVYQSDSSWPLSDILNSAIADSNRATVLTISYGYSDSFYSHSMYDPLIAHTDHLFQVLGLLGVSIIVSSGDLGSFVNFSSNQTCDIVSIQYPASSPYVLSVGATQLVATVDGHCPIEVMASMEFGGDFTSTGGISDRYALPEWQATASAGYFSFRNNSNRNFPNFLYNPLHRSTPDIVLAGNNFPQAYHGWEDSDGGTSASSPLFAAQVALVNAARATTGQSPLGFIAPLLYHAASQDPRTFRDIRYGNTRCRENDQDCCPSGWSACDGFDIATGLGVPRWTYLQTFANVTLDLGQATDVTSFPDCLDADPSLTSSSSSSSSTGLTQLSTGVTSGTSSFSTAISSSTAPTASTASSSATFSTASSTSSTSGSSPSVANSSSSSGTMLIASSSGIIASTSSIILSSSSTGPGSSAEVTPNSSSSGIAASSSQPSSTSSSSSTGSTHGSVSGYDISSTSVTDSSSGSAFSSSLPFSSTAAVISSSAVLSSSSAFPELASSTAATDNQPTATIDESSSSTASESSSVLFSSSSSTAAASSSSSSMIPLESSSSSSTGSNSDLSTQDVLLHFFLDPTAFTAAFEQSLEQAISNACNITLNRLSIQSVVSGGNGSYVTISFAPATAVASSSSESSAVAAIGAFVQQFNDPSSALRNADAFKQVDSNFQPQAFAVAPTSIPTSETNSSSSVPIAFVVGVSCGAFVLLVVIVVGSLCWRRKRKEVARSNARALRYPAIINMAAFTDLSQEPL